MHLRVPEGWSCPGYSMTRRTCICMPSKHKIEQVADEYGYKSKADDAANVPVAWYAWTDWPCRKRNSIADKDKSVHGVGKNPPGFDVGDCAASPSSLARDSLFRSRHAFSQGFFLSAHRRFPRSRVPCYARGVRWFVVGRSAPSVGCVMPRHSSSVKAYLKRRGATRPSWLRVSLDPRLRQDGTLANHPMAALFNPLGKSMAAPRDWLCCAFLQPAYI